MQVLITHGSMARTRVLQFSRLQLVAAGLVLACLLMLVSGAIYHFIFLKAAREGWPVVSSLVRLVVRDEIAQRDRFMRENLDAIAQKVGEMQAKLVKLEAMGERVSGLAGVKPDDLRPLQRTDAGGRAARSCRRRWPSPRCSSCSSWSSGLDAGHRPAHRRLHPDRVAPARNAACRR